MKVRLACVDDLNEIMELYHLVSDMMEDSDILIQAGVKKFIQPKKIVLLDIEQQNTLRFRKK